jgi:hypothetical protein
MNLIASTSTWEMNMRDRLLDDTWKKTSIIWSEGFLLNKASWSKWSILLVKGLRSNATYTSLERSHSNCWLNKEKRKQYISYECCLNSVTVAYIILQVVLFRNCCSIKGTKHTPYLRLDWPIPCKYLVGCNILYDNCKKNLYRPGWSLNV